MEQKTGPQYTKTISGRTVTGVFSVFGNVDSYGDVIHPGAFVNTMRQRQGKLVHLWQHDMSSPPIAKITGIRELSRAELPAAIRQEAPEATGGAEVTREYLDTPRGNEVLAVLKSGAPLQMSFAFNTVRYDFEERRSGDQVRNLRELELMETSDVLWGANAATLAVRRAGSGGDLDELHARALTYLRSYVAASRQLGVKEGRVLSGESRKRIERAVEALAAARDALDELLDAAEAGKGRGVISHQLRMQWHELQRRTARLGRLADDLDSCA